MENFSIPKIRRVLSGIFFILSSQGSSLAQDCTLYKKVLLPEVVSYCLVAEGVVKPKEAFMIDEYQLLNAKEVERAKKDINPTIKDMKGFIVQNGYCKKIISVWKDKSFSLWCPSHSNKSAKPEEKAKESFNQKPRFFAYHK